MLDLACAYVGGLPSLNSYIVGTANVTNLKKIFCAFNMEIPLEIKKRLDKMAGEQKIWSNPKTWTLK
jgi:hypothetical protein